MHRPWTLALSCLLLFPLSASSEGKGASKLSPAQMLRRALIPQNQALIACGVRWEGGKRRAVAHFGLDFSGRVKGLRIEGIDGRDATRECLAKSLSELRLPVRLAYVVRTIALPLPLSE